MATRGEKVRAKILEFLQKKEDKVRFSGIADKFRKDVTERTILRILENLVAEDLVERSGEPKHYFYSAAGPRGKKAPLAVEVDETIPLSDNSRELLRYLDQPKEKRKPVGYNRAFLDAYVPNETYYLPEDIRNLLKNHGAIPNGPGDELGDTTQGRIYQRLLIDLSWASSRLEGNTYSLLDTERLLEFGEMASDKNVDEATMILNHRDAISFMITERETIGVNRFTLLNLHGFLSHSLMPDPADEGRLRRKIVEIGQSVYVPPAIPQVIEEVFDEIIVKGAEIQDPVEQSFFLLTHLPYLQPFTDVNKRTARLAANIPFLKANLAPLSFLDVPERHYISGVLGVYELNKVDLLRDVFVWTYERSCAHYTAHRQELRVSDKKRFLYRQDLAKTTREIVQGRLNPSTEAILELSGRNIPKDDEPDFIRLVQENLERLHEGNIARYGINLEEYKSWAEAQKRGG